MGLGQGTDDMFETDAGAAKAKNPPAPEKGKAKAVAMEADDKGSERLVAEKAGEAMAAEGCRHFVFSSTCATYGVPQQVPITEEHPQNPITPYGRSKWMVELMLEDLAAAVYLLIGGLVALGLVHPKRVKRNADAKVGDRLVLGKPVGVGVLSAALKKDALSTDGYAQMIANTTKLNTPGPELAELAGVHALTDVTGFGLAGHVLEIARGANMTVHINWADVPLLPNVSALLKDGNLTGASGRNWEGYGHEISLASGLPAETGGPPPCILRARTVATITAHFGLRPDSRHLILKNS